MIAEGETQNLPDFTGRFCWLTYVYQALVAEVANPDHQSTWQHHVLHACVAKSMPHDYASSAQHPGVLRLEQWTRNYMVGRKRSHYPKFGVEPLIRLKRRCPSSADG